jgi:hypothetical protein
MAVAEPYPLEGETEARINLIRSASIALLYGVHLVHYVSGGLAGAFDSANASVLARQVHLSATVIVMGWLMVAAGVHLALVQRVSSRWIGSMSTVCDLVFLTSALIVSTGPSGALVAGYFLIIMLSGLRHRLPLVWLATAGSIVGYLVVLGFAKWAGGWFRLLGIETVPRYHQVMTGVAMVLAGVIAGQYVRRFLALAPRANSGKS